MNYVQSLHTLISLRLKQKREATTYLIDLSRPLPPRRRPTPHRGRTHPRRRRPRLIIHTPHLLRRNRTLIRQHPRRFSCARVHGGASTPPRPVSQLLQFFAHPLRPLLLRLGGLARGVVPVRVELGSEDRVEGEREDEGEEDEGVVDFLEGCEDAGEAAEDLGDYWEGGRRVLAGT